MKLPRIIMYKKILILSLIIPSVIVAHNLSQEQLKELATKEMPTLTRKFLPKEKQNSESPIKEKLQELKNAQKKQDSELKKAKEDLKETAIAVMTAFTVYKGLDYVNNPSGLPWGLEDKLTHIFGRTMNDIIGPAVGSALVLAEIGIIAYAMYKAAASFIHLNNHFFKFDYPKPEEKSH